MNENQIVIQRPSSLLSCHEISVDSVLGVALVFVAVSQKKKTTYVRFTIRRVITKHANSGVIFHWRVLQEIRMI